MQNALTTAISGNEIWTAAGTYKPTTNPTNRDAAFQLKSGVALYGGFSGTETARDQRNPATNLTILSGDIDNNDSQMPIITNLTTVTGNTTNSYHVVIGAPGIGATLDGFTITAGNANSASPNDHGGGMYNDASSPTLANVTFSGNSADGGGGGMYNDNYSSPTLTKVAFSSNSTTGGSGAMYNDNFSSPMLTNVTFSGNGGGMYNYDYSSPTLTNVTFSANFGVGMNNSSRSNPQICNTIFWGNSGGQIMNSDSTPIISDSVVQDGYPLGTNIITADPKLGPLGNYGGSTLTVPLMPGSSAIDAGNDAACPSTDQRGVARPQGAHCDIGAYEEDGTVIDYIFYAKPTASGTGDCSSWANACILQNALTTAISGNEIWTAAGTHKPTTNPTNRDATFRLKNGVALYGGFVGTETARDQRNPATNLTILSGDIDNNDSQTPIITELTAVTGNTTNSYHIVIGETGTSATLDGFTITAGNANSASPNDRGGGMYNKYSGPTLTNITFSGNYATSGGGMYNDTLSYPTLTKVIFSSNGATDGGGMYNYNYGSPALTNVTFSRNLADDGSGSGRGGGMYNYLSSPTLTGVTFSRNAATSGGGMYNQNSKPTLTNVTFSRNAASSGGGMYNGILCSPVLTNVTFNNNSAYFGKGGGMYNNSASPTFYPQIRNTIFWGNTAYITGSQIYNDATSPVVRTSVVQGGCPAGSTCTNIITANPLLGPLGNYGGSTQIVPLLPGSSAIDAGNGTYCPILDQRGKSRSTPNCDIGSFESQGFTLVISGGNNQSAAVNSIFVDLLSVTVSPLNAGEPVDGGQVTFTAPGSGASAIISGTATISSGAASVTATANNILGTYNVSASIPGVSPVSFSLENINRAIYTLFLPLILR